jgi:ribosomal protein L37E
VKEIIRDYDSQARTLVDRLVTQARTPCERCNHILGYHDQHGGCALCVFMRYAGTWLDAPCGFTGSTTAGSASWGGEGTQL